MNTTVERAFRTLALLLAALTALALTQAGTAAAATGASIIDVDDTDEGYVAVVADSGGGVDTFYTAGEGAPWQKVDDKYGAGQFTTGVEQIAFDDIDGNDVFEGVAVGVDGDGQVRAGTAYEHYGKPRFNKTKGDPVGDLTSIIDVVSTGESFVVVGIGAGGDVDAWYSTDGDIWTPLPDKYDADLFKPGVEKVAFGDVDGNGRYEGMSFGVKDGAVKAQGVYEHYDKPRFNKGNGKTVGDLTSIIDVSTTDEGFVVVGVGAGGDVDAWYSSDADPATWEKIVDKFDAQNFWPGVQQITFADVDGDGQFYGYSFGVKDNTPRAQDNYEFSDSPRFNAGNGDKLE